MKDDLKNMMDLFMCRHKYKIAEMSLFGYVNYWILNAFRNKKLPQSEGKKHALKILISV